MAAANEQDTPTKPCTPERHLEHRVDMKSVPPPADSVTRTASLESVELDDDPSEATAPANIGHLGQEEKTHLPSERGPMSATEKFVSIAKRVGAAMLWGAEFIGEVGAEFLGLNDSKFQYVVDAYNRHVEQVNQEKKARRKARKRRRKERAERLARLEAGLPSQSQTHALGQTAYAPSTHPEADGKTTHAKIDSNPPTESLSTQTLNPFSSESCMAHYKDNSVIGVHRPEPVALDGDQPQPQPQPQPETQTQPQPETQPQPQTQTQQSVSVADAQLRSEM